MSKPSSASGVTDCPCDSGHPYADCCGRYHDGPLVGRAPDAAALMRSRYSAFVCRRADYLLATWHPSTRPTKLELDPLRPRWLGLTVRGHQRLDDQHATVEFVARSREAGRATRLHELSRFVLEGGRWWYVDGDQLGRA